MRKYEFTGVERNGLKQIRRISDGLIGGWIEKEENLSHEDDCFVFDNAQVFSDARISGDAWVSGDAHIYRNAQVFGDARISGNAQVFGNAQLFGNARVSGNARVYGNARLSGDAWVYGNAQVCGDAEVKTLHCFFYITNLEYPFTYTKSNNTLKIGCESKTIDEWWSVTYQREEEAPLCTKMFRLLFIEQKPKG